MRSKLTLRFFLKVDENQIIFLMIPKCFEEKCFQQKENITIISWWPSGNNKRLSIHLRYFGLSAILIHWENKMLDGKTMLYTLSCLVLKRLSIFSYLLFFKRLQARTVLLHSLWFAKNVTSNHKKFWSNKFKLLILFISSLCKPWKNN